MKSLVTFLAIFSFLFTAGVSESNAREIKALSYNVWGLPFPIAKRLKRLQLIRNKIPEYQADIVALQEVFTKKAKRILKQTHYPFVAKGPKGTTLKFSSGLALLSKFPIIESKTIKYHQCQGWDCKANKGVLFSRLDLGDEHLDVYVTHLNAEGKDHHSRLNQINQMIRFVQDNSVGNKTLFLGDFNFTEDSILHALLKQRLGIVDSHQEYVLDNPQLPDNVRLGATSSGNERIDYIWSTNDLKVERSQVVFHEKLYKNKQLSDHKAVLTTFDL